MTSVLIILTIACAAAAIVAAYRAQWASLVLAFAALAGCAFVPGSNIAGATLWFWGCTAAVAVALMLILPPSVRNATIGMPYICTGALAGAIVGMSLNTRAAIIIGAVAGIIVASFAMGRLKPGQQLGFPSRKFFNYLLAKGLPTIITFSIIGIACLNLFVILR